MKTDPFAFSNDEKRYPTTQERQTGFPCGPAELNLFNGMFHRLESEVGHVIDYAGLVGVDTDLEQLRKAIQLLILSALAGFEDTAGGIDTSQFILMTQARTRLPIFPEIQTATGKLGIVSPGTGVARVPASVTFLHRGIFPIQTVQTDLNTLASKVYHLRWNPTDGFALKDLSDVGYNPTSAAETSTIFDTTFDDMLVARVVSNGSNILTITDLVNRDRLSAEIYDAGAITTLSRKNGAERSAPLVWNWSRRPLMSVTARHIYTSPDPDGSGGWSGTMQHDHDQRCEESVARTRYGVTLRLFRDYAFQYDIDVQLTA